MIKTILRKTMFLMIGFVVVLALASCGEKEDKIVIGQGDWASNAFHDQVVKFIIENGYDTEVDIILTDTPVLITSLASGDVDLNTELWSDNIPTYEDDIAEGKYVYVSTNYDDNEQGLYVPTYMVEGEDAIAPDLETVQDLENYAHLFPDPEGGDKGIIYGGPEGWQVTQFLHQKIEAYGLDDYYKFKTIDSSSTLAATIAGAYEKEEAWVGYYWSPTWVLGLYDMTLLGDSPYNEEDHENGVGAMPTVDVNVVVNSEFEEKYPEIFAFLSNYETSSDVTSEALAYMQENEAEAEEAARYFLENHQELWTEWLPEEVKQKVLDALDE